MPLTAPLTLDSAAGKYQARLFPDDGTIALAGPDPSGSPLKNVVTLQPIQAHLAAGTVPLGRVLGSPRIGPNRLEVDQDLGGAKATTRISFVDGGVMRFEVIGWGGTTPRDVTITAAPGPAEHFFGFGERFNKLDQAGRTVEIRTQDQPANKFDPNDDQKPDFAYKAVPWFLSSRGYGFHLDSAVESTFDMHRTADRLFQVKLPFLPDRSPSLALHLISGPKLTDVLSRYTGLAGRPPCRPPGRSARGSPPTPGATGARSGTPSRSSSSETSPPRRSSSTPPGNSPTTTSYSISGGRRPATGSPPPRRRSSARRASMRTSRRRRAGSTPSSSRSPR